jgi:hypothetical protein
VTDDARGAAAAQTKEETPMVRKVERDDGDCVSTGFAVELEFSEREVEWITAGMNRRGELRAEAFLVGLIQEGLDRLGVLPPGFLTPAPARVTDC